MWLDSADLERRLRELAPVRIAVALGRNPGLPLLVGDGAGGAYVAWALGRRFADGEESSVRVLRITGGSTVAAGWPADGIELESGQGHLGLVGLLADDEGGALVGRRRLVGDTLESIRMQRLAPSGAAAPGWPRAGIPLGEGVIPAQLVTDGAGGVTMVRQVPVSGATRVTHITKEGVVDPGWPGYPTQARLFPPYPQPASDAVSIRLAMPALGPLDAEVYDVTGRLVRELVREPEFPAGQHTLIWDGRDDGGRLAPSGVYLVRVTLAGEVASTRVVLAR